MKIEQRIYHQCIAANYNYYTHAYLLYSDYQCTQLPDQLYTDGFIIKLGELLNTIIKY